MTTLPDHGAAPLRVVIAEDSVLLREGLVRLLTETGFEVAAAVADAESFLRAVEAAPPDLVVVDVRMPPTFTDEGVRAALVVREQFPGRRGRRPQPVRGGELRDRSRRRDFVEALRRVAAGGTARIPGPVGGGPDCAGRAGPAGAPGAPGGSGDEGPTTVLTTGPRHARASAGPPARAGGPARPAGGRAWRPSTRRSCRSCCRGPGGVTRWSD